MPGVLVRLIVTSISVVVAAYVLPGQLAVEGVGSVVMFALVLGILNVLVKPVLLLTLPLNILTLGLFTLVINGVVFWMAAQLPLGVRVSGFTGALFAAVVVSVVSFVLTKVIP